MTWSTDEYAVDPRAAFDALRDRCPLARGADGTWMVTGHVEAVSCALNSEAFSNRVSSRLQIPNGLDGPEHRRFRTLLDGFFSASKVAALKPRFQGIADGLIATLPRRSPVDAVWQLGAVAAVRFQSAWLGWPAEIEATLLQWMVDYREALRSRQSAALADVTTRFEAIVAAQIERSRLRASHGALEVTGELLDAEVEDPLAPGGSRTLEASEIVSILRNWTAGDLGTIAACVGVVAHRLATDRELQSALRAQLEQPDAIDDAIDECLRIDDPFMWNRRTTTREVQLAGQVIPAGAKVIINWMAANRDPRRFAAPDAFSPVANRAHNIVYGAGPHVCPGRQLATAQLSTAFTALLRSTTEVRLADVATSTRSGIGGYDTVPVILE